MDEAGNHGCEVEGRGEQSTTPGGTDDTGDGWRK